MSDLSFIYLLLFAIAFLASYESVEYVKYTTFLLSFTTIGTSIKSRTLLGANLWIILSVNLLMVQLMDLSNVNSANGTSDPRSSVDSPE